MKFIASVALGFSLLLAGTAHSAEPANIEWKRVDDRAEALYVAKKYGEALIATQEALVIAEKTEATRPLDVATTIERLAGIYLATARYGEAERLLHRVITLREKT